MSHQNKWTDRGRLTDVPVEVRPLKPRLIVVHVQHVDADWTIHLGANLEKNYKYYFLHSE